MKYTLVYFVLSGLIITLDCQDRRRKGKKRGEDDALRDTTRDTQNKQIIKGRG